MKRSKVLWGSIALVVVLMMAFSVFPVIGGATDDAATADIEAISAELDDGATGIVESFDPVDDGTTDIMPATDTVTNDDGFNWWWLLLLLPLLALLAWWLLKPKKDVDDVRYKKNRDRC